MAWKWANDKLFINCFCHYPSPFWTTTPSWSKQWLLNFLHPYLSPFKTTTSFKSVISKSIIELKKWPCATTYIKGFPNNNVMGIPLKRSIWQSNFSMAAEECRKLPFLALRGQFLSKCDIVIPKTPLWRYDGLDPKIIILVILKRMALLLVWRGISMMSLLGNPFGTGNYNFYTCQYWPCIINFPKILTQNCHGKINCNPWTWVQ